MFFRGIVGNSPDLGNLYGVLGGSSGVVLNLELLHQLIKSEKKFAELLFPFTSGTRDRDVTL